MFPKALLLSLLATLAACSASTERTTSTLENGDDVGSRVSEADRVALEAECVQEYGYRAWSDGRVLFVDEGSEANSADVDRVVSQCMEEVEKRYPRMPATDMFSSEEARTPVSYTHLTLPTIYSV